MRPSVSLGVCWLAGCPKEQNRRHACGSTQAKERLSEGTSRGHNLWPNAEIIPISA